MVDEEVKICSRSSETLSNKEEENDGEYVVYWYRWLALVSYFLVASQNNSQWICFSPVVNTVADFFRCSSFWVYSSILVFDLFSPVSFLASIFISRYGSRDGILVAAVGTLVGGWIKAMYLEVPGQIIGQCLMAFSHVFSAVGQPLFSAVWFPTSQRPLSTSFLFFATVFGGGIGFIMAPLIIKKPDDTPFFLFIQAIIGTVVCIPCLFIPNNPPTPPSKSAEVAQYHLPTSFLKDISSMFKQPQFILLLLGFSGGFAILNTVAITSNDIFNKFQYSNIQIGIIGAGTVFCGMFGCVFISIFTDKTDFFRGSMVVCNAMTGISMLVLYFVLRPNNYLIVCICVFVAGFFGISAFPVAYEVGCEVLFPIHEAVTTGVMTVVAQLFSIILTVIEYYVFEDKSWVPFAAAILYIFVVIFLLCFKGSLKRRDLDRQKEDLKNFI